jgi:hypothetical protein
MASVIVPELDARDFLIQRDWSAKTQACTMS